LYEKIKKFQQDFNRHVQVEKQCVAEPLGIIFTMLNPTLDKPIRVHQDWINRISDTKVFPIFKNYLFKNNGLFSENRPVLSRYLSPTQENHISVQHLRQMVVEVLECMKEPLISPKLQERQNNIRLKLYAKKTENYSQAA
jgi:hypothetical protein